MVGQLAGVTLADEVYTLTADQQPAAVDGQGRAGDVAGVVGEQIRDGLGFTDWPQRQDRRLLFVAVTTVVEVNRPD